MASIRIADLATIRQIYENRWSQVEADVDVANKNVKNSVKKHKDVFDTVREKLNKIRAKSVDRFLAEKRALEYKSQREAIGTSTRRDLSSDRLVGKTEYDPPRSRFADHWIGREVRRHPPVEIEKSNDQKMIKERFERMARRDYFAKAGSKFPVQSNNFARSRTVPLPREDRERGRPRDVAPRSLHKPERAAREGSWDRVSITSAQWERMREQSKERYTRMSDRNSVMSIPVSTVIKDARSQSHDRMLSTGPEPPSSFSRASSVDRFRNNERPQRLLTNSNAQDTHESQKPLLHTCPRPSSSSSRASSVDRFKSGERLQRNFYRNSLQYLAKRCDQPGNKVFVGARSQSLDTTLDRRGGMLPESSRTAVMSPSESAWVRSREVDKRRCISNEDLLNSAMPYLSKMPRNYSNTLSSVMSSRTRYRNVEMLNNKDEMVGAVDSRHDVELMNLRNEIDSRNRRAGNSNTTSEKRRLRRKPNVKHSINKNRLHRLASKNSGSVESVHQLRDSGQSATQRPDRPSSRTMSADRWTANQRSRMVGSRDLSVDRIRWSTARETDNSVGRLQELLASKQFDGLKNFENTLTNKRNSKTSGNSVRTGVQRASNRSKSADTATRCSTVCAECCTTCNPGSALSRSSKGQRSSNRSRVSKSEHEREVKREGKESKHHYQNFALEPPSSYDVDSDEMDPIYAVLQNTPYKVERAEEKVYSLTKPSAKQLNGIHKQLVQAEVYNSSGLPAVPGRPNKKGKHPKHQHRQQDHHGDICSHRTNQKVHNHNDQNNATNGNSPLQNGNLPHGRYSNGVLADNVFVPDPDYDSFDVIQRNEQNGSRGTKQKLLENSRKRDVIGDRLRKTSGSSQVSGDSGIDSYPPTFDDYLQALGPGSKSSPHSRQGSRSSGGSGGSGGEPQVGTETVQKSVTFKNSAVVMDSSDADDEEEQLTSFQLKIREKARMMEHKQKQSSVLNDDDGNSKARRHLPFQQMDDNSSNGNDSTTVDAASTSSADFSSPSQLSPSSTSSNDSLHVKTRSVQPFKQQQFTVQGDQYRGSSLLSSQKQKVQGELKNFLGKRLSIDDISLLKKQSPSSDKFDGCGDNDGAFDETKVSEHSSEESSLTISCDDQLNNVINSENKMSVDLPPMRTDAPPNTLDISTDLSSISALQAGGVPAPPPPPPPLPPPGGIVSASASTSKSSTPSSTAPSTPLSTGPAISLKELQSVSLKKANISKGNDTGMNQVRNDDLIAELKSTTGITSLKKLRDDMVKRNQDLHQAPLIELDPTDFTPDRFMTKVPEATPDGKSIPPWKRQLIAKKEAEKAKKETEEKLKKNAEEQRLAKIPKWKREIIEKKEAEARAAREAVEKAIKEREERERQEKTPKVVAAIPIDVEENKPLAPWIQELRSRKS